MFAKSLYDRQLGRKPFILAAVNTICLYIVILMNSFFFKVNFSNDIMQKYWLVAGRVQICFGKGMHF